MNPILKIVLIAILSIAALIACFAFYITRGLASGAKVAISAVSLSEKKDGVYEGTYNSGRWTNTVAVSVTSGKISDIKLKKDVLFVKEGISGKLFSDVIKAQNTTVDTVSGATVTSKAYLKSIENALSK